MYKKQMINKKQKKENNKVINREEEVKFYNDNNNDDYDNALVSGGSPITPDIFIPIKLYLKLSCLRF